MKRELLIAIFVGFCTVQVCAQILDNSSEAFKRAEETGKPVLLIFSGSDWCAPCIRFSKNVLTKETFLDYAADHLILLKADFPQRKRLADDLRKQNETLAERYNPSGQFPHILLLHADGTVISILSYRNQKPEEFISQLSAHFAE